MSDFKSDYDGEKRWYVKVLLMRVYHLQQKKDYSRWRIQDTARYFDVSIGLVSENLKLARYYSRIKSCPNREEALRKIRWN